MAANCEPPNSGRRVAVKVLMRDDQVLMGHEDPRPPLLLPSLGGSMPPLGPLGSLALPPYYYYPYFNPHSAAAAAGAGPLSQFGSLPQLSALSAASLSSLSTSLANSLLPHHPPTTSSPAPPPPTNPSGLPRSSSAGNVSIPSSPRQ